MLFFSFLEGIPYVSRGLFRIAWVEEAEYEENFEPLLRFCSRSIRTAPLFWLPATSLSTHFPHIFKDTLITSPNSPGLESVVCLVMKCKELTLFLMYDRCHGLTYRRAFISSSLFPFVFPLWFDLYFYDLLESITTHRMLG